MNLKDKNVVLGVSGGIAAYKSIELLRLLKKAGASITVIMTKNAEKFVAPLTFEALSKNKVFLSFFDTNENTSIKHIEIAENCDAVIIAPATANIIGKFANGIADDALSTFMLAVTSHKIICPAMNSNMYENIAVQRNIDILEKDGFTIIEPGTGELACKTSGVGRLREPYIIMDRVIKALSKKDLKGKKALITAGPTREHIDPVRFISNPSSGKMGYAIARAAELRGAEVILISGPSNLDSPIGVELIKVTSASEMAKAVFKHAETSDIIIKTAAVSDYKPVSYSEHKMKKGENEITINFSQNVDILKELGKIKKQNQIIIGFAAETQDLEKNAKQKLEKKNLDMIVGNIVGTDKSLGRNSGFEAETNKASFFFKDRIKEPLPLMPKEELADILLDRICEWK
jgi:phosphopantothenoylcysteine decarboxylase / phosphopantothenate---cysteine ligase